MRTPGAFLLAALLLVSSGAEGKLLRDIGRHNVTAADAAATAADAAAQSQWLQGFRAKVEAVTEVAKVNNTGYANATAGLEPSCAKACDKCFAAHSMNCYAQCYRGLQMYCQNKCVSAASCTPQWSAIPGQCMGEGCGTTKKFCNGMTDVDGCPTQNYNR